MIQGESEVFLAMVGLTRLSLDWCVLGLLVTEESGGRVSELSDEDRVCIKVDLQELHLHGVCRVECLQTSFKEFLVIFSLKVFIAVNASEFRDKDFQCESR